MAPRKTGKSDGSTDGDRKGKGRGKGKSKPPRREPGTGSFYKDGPGWRITFPLANGQVHRERAASEKAAEARLAELNQLKDQKIDIGASSQTLTSWLDVWYQLRTESEALKPRTLMHYRSMIERYITPMLGSFPLSDLTPALIQQFVFSVRNETRQKYKATNQQREREGKAPMRAHNGIKTARDCAMVLKMALDLAVARKVLAESPYRGIQLPKPPKRAPKPLSVEALLKQLRAFLAAASNHPLSPLWHTYALLGLRLGEGLGLTWGGWNQETGLLHIFQQVQTIPKSDDRPQKLDIGSPKSEAGERYLPVPGVLQRMYADHRMTYEAMRKRSGENWKGEQYDLMFCNRDGGMLWPRNLDEDYRALCALAGLPRSFTLHQLRHAVASLLDTLPGITEATKAEILGHKKGSITLYYTHGSNEAKRRVLEALAQLILGDQAADDDTPTTS